MFLIRLFFEREKCLTFFSQLYFIPLKYASRLKSEVVIPKEDLNKIFYGFYTIFELNKTFEQELQALKHNNTLYLKLGQVFRLFVRTTNPRYHFINFISFAGSVNEAVH
jgi:hypothetical protein